MLSLSNNVGYAIRGLAQLESSGDRGFVKNIARDAGVPPAYLAKLFKKLADAGILETKRGWSGGTCLARPAEEISVLEVAEALDGEDWFSRCLLGMDDCSAQRSCPTHDFWEATRASVKQELRRVTLRAVIDYEREQRAGSAAKNPSCGGRSPSSNENSES